MATSNLELLRQLRDAVRRAGDAAHRAHELELADLDRQIQALERARPVSHTTQLAGHEHEHERALLRVMQAAGTPLPPREIASRLDAAPKTVCRWLAAAKQRGYVERVDRARYQVRKEVPML
jgi:predicted Rossmann fold nucleotide-binding protein DprA/Smf involved in DNA uptake